MQSTENTLGTIGFVGLGDMGASIAANYARNGLTLLAYDLRSELESEVLSWNGSWARTSAELLQSSDVLCLCLLDDKQVRGFVDRERAFDLLRPGSVLVVHSTVSPGLMGDLAREGAERGVQVVDAPVSGSHAAREAGALTVMVGATAETFERLRPMWTAISTHAYRIGDAPGSAQVVKLCNNMMGLTNNLVALEAVKIARAYGIDENVLLDVARTSSGNSFFVENWGISDRLLLGHEHGGAAAGFAIMLKDIRTAVGAGTDAGVSTEIAAVAGTIGEHILGERLEYLQRKAQSQQEHTT